MINLYVSPSIYQEHNGTDSDLDLLFHNKSVRLFLDVDEFGLEDCINEDDSNRDKGQDNDERSPKSGKAFVDLIKDEFPVTVGLSRCILLLADIEKEAAMSIRKKYGIMCYTEKEIPVLLNNLTSKSKYTTKVVYDDRGEVAYSDADENEKKFALTAPAASDRRGWDYFFAPFKNTPKNAIIFIDRHIKNDYIKTNKNHIPDNIFDNVIQIINNCISCNCKQEIHILLIAGADKKDSEKNRTVFLTTHIPAINERLQSLTSKCSFLVEYIFCDNLIGMNDLYLHIHDRHVYSNYMTIDAPKSIAAFRYNKNVVVNSQQSQKLSVLSCFPDGLEYSPYVESEEDCKSAYINDIVSDLADGIVTKCSGNDRYSYETYRINATQGIVPIEIKDKENIRNRMIMDEIELKDGDNCWYISVPYCNDWANIKVSDPHVFHENEREAFKRCIWRKKDRADKKELVDIANKIREIFKNREYPQVEKDDEKFYRVVVPYPSDLKSYDEKNDIWKSSIHVLGSKQCEKASNQYKYNCFAKEKDAMIVANKLSKLLGMDPVYTDSEINGIQEIKKRGYFFIPWVPSESSFLFHDKRILVVGASHNCIHKECKFYCDCTNCDVSRGNSMLYNNSCPYPDYDRQLEETTKYIVESYIKNPDDNKSFKNFTEFMRNHFEKNKEFSEFAKDFWNRVAFVNYGQNFEWAKRGNHFEESDFKSFTTYLNKIKPNVVIIWGTSVGNALTDKDFKPSANNLDIKETNGYYWKGEEKYGGIEFINCYHPCNGEVKLDDGGRFKKVLDKVFGNSDNDNKTLQVNEAPSEQSANTNVQTQQRNSAQQRTLKDIKKSK